MVLSIKNLFLLILWIIIVILVSVYIFNQRLKLLLLFIGIIIIVIIHFTYFSYSTFSIPPKHSSLLQTPSIGNYRFYNPSLALSDSTLYITFRKSSFHKCNGTTFGDPLMNYQGNVNQVVITTLDQHFKPDLNKMHVYCLPKNPKILEQINLKISNKCPEFGIEDVRLLYDPLLKMIHGSGTFTYCSKLWFYKLMYYFRWNPQTFEIENELLLQSEYSNKGDQKNWMMVLHHSQVYFIQYLFPTYILLKLNPQTGKCKLVKKESYSNSSFPYKLRGSTSAIQLQDGSYLGIAHTRNYKHVFYMLDSSLNLFALSPLLKFDIEDHSYHYNLIQFSCGMVVKEDQVIIAYGEQDCISKIIKYPLKTILISLRKIVPNTNK